MIKPYFLIFSGLVLVLLVLTGILYQPVIRPWHFHWGATGAEIQASLVGDETVSQAVSQTTRAIDIQAPAAAVWPWLVQMGQGRGGLYSYDFLENLAGCDIHTLDGIEPGLQNLAVGDTIKIGPQEGLPYYRVIILDPDKALVLRSINPVTSEPGETWGFYLEEKDSEHTRLIIRHRAPPGLNSTERIVNGVFEPISFVMEHRMLHGIRDRAEKNTR
jgi:hypothetical protein